ncbi:Exocyst complex component SEC5 [Psidium guajava]|nr:Exocyst complex component SEC5 [Psidium guajava]
MTHCIPLIEWIVVVALTINSYSVNNRRYRESICSFVTPPPYQFGSTFVVE